jgi:inner membrane transporter RhtA
VIPYRLELEALRRIPARVFGIWMSLEPAVAALAGLVILGEALSGRQWLAVGAVMVASAGAARGEGGTAAAAPAGREPAPAAEPAGPDAAAGREREGAGLPPSPGA